MNIVSKRKVLEKQSVLKLVRYMAVSMQTTAHVDPCAWPKMSTVGI